MLRGKGENVAVFAMGDIESAFMTTDDDGEKLYIKTYEAEHVWTLRDRGCLLTSDQWKDVEVAMLARVKEDKEIEDLLPMRMLSKL